MTAQSEAIPYWVRTEATVLLAAAGLSVLGAGAWIATLPRPSFELTDLILPSCLTWAVLAPFVARATIRRALLIGLLSPFLGSVFVILLRIGPTKEFVYKNPMGIFGVLLYAFSYIGITAWTTLPVGALAGLVMHRIFQWWPPPPREQSKWNGPQSLSSRLLISALPLVPLLALLIPDTVVGPRVVMNPWRLLAELYFLPLFVIRAVDLRAGWMFMLVPGVDAILHIAYAAFLSVMLYRALTRRAH
jgi:hypothetical protein